MKRYQANDLNIIQDAVVDMYECTDCGFEYNANHTVDDEEGGYE